MGVATRAQWAIRRGLAPARLRPNFLVIGAQKSGTTSLHRYLADHPAVVCAVPKEVHYFDTYYAHSDAWYLTHFPLSTRATVVRRRHGVSPAVGELTPCYLFHPRVPARVHAFDPGLRLAAVLRDPVERAYSQYQMQVRRRGEALSFTEALDLEDEYLSRELGLVNEDPEYVSSTGFRRSYVARGRYADQLERWLDLFPQEQLLVLTSEELWADPGAATRAVTEFLGVPDWAPTAYPYQSVGTHAPMTAEERERLARTFAPENRRLEELLGRTLQWTKPSGPATRA